MLGNLTGWHFLIILAIVLLVFGATRLPALARSVGQSMKVFKEEFKPENAKPMDPVAPEAAPVSDHKPV